jgi:exopolysaccharide biosynthesis polyprenyl glycosylphosphotransferase
MLKEHHKLFKRVVLWADLCLVSASFFASYFIRDNIESILPYLPPDFELLTLASLGFYAGLLPVLLVIWGALLSYFGMYKSFYIKTSRALVIVLKTAVLGFIIFGSYIFILRMQNEVSRLIIVYTFLLSTILISLEKIALFNYFSVMNKRDLNFKSSLIVFRRVLVIGTGKRTKRFIDLIKKNPGWGIKIVGLVDLDPDKKGREIYGYKVFGTFEDVPAIIHENIIDEVIFIVPRSWINNIEDMMKFCETEGIRVHIAADFFKLEFSRAKFTDINGFPLLTFESTSEKLGHLFIKRLFDFAVSGILLFCLSFFFIIISIIIKNASEGPVFFKQIRCGLYGRQFTFYKFRTMVVDAESRLDDLMSYNEMKGPVFKMTNDPRVTKVGKWLRKYSIDELPQLWNVLKGDMSLVGPRPPLPIEVEKYTPLQRRRMSMRPGITCLWQIRGRSQISDFNKWLKMDLEYIDNWSLGLDLEILVKSIPVVLLGEGAK